MKVMFNFSLQGFKKIMSYVTHVHQAEQEAHNHDYAYVHKIAKGHDQGNMYSCSQS